MGTEKKRHILIIRLSALGDIAISAPLIREYAIRNPGIKFTMVSQKLVEPFFTGIDNLNFVSINLKQDGNFKGVLKFAKSLLKLKPTEVADIHNVLRSRIIRYYLMLHGIPCKVVNKNRAGRRGLTKRKNKNLTPINSSQRNYEEVLVALKLKDINFANTPVTQRKNNNIGVRKIGIAPFAKHKGKCWPLEYMEEVVSTLSKDSNNKIILFGGGTEEAKILMGWEQKYSNTQSVVGKYTLGQELEFIKELDVMVSMDSANMHFASFVGVPVISIWGATHPSAGFYGWGQDMRNAVQGDISCRPCSIYGNKECLRGDYACLWEIKPERVVSKIMEII